MPPSRRQLVGLVDESSTLGSVDYPRMLSELGKYGASFVLVTQSLAKLEAIDRNLAPTIFANSDGLTAFQVSADDARRLAPELGGGIEVEDLVSLDDFTATRAGGMATVGHRRSRSGWIRRLPTYPDGPERSRAGPPPATAARARRWSRRSPAP